jgi:hypothetical protein
MWLLDNVYKPLICNEFICGKTLFYPSDAMFAYENGCFAPGFSAGFSAGFAVQWALRTGLARPATP